MFEDIEVEPYLGNKTGWRLEVGNVIYSGTLSIVENIDLKMQDSGHFWFNTSSIDGYDITATIYTCIPYIAAAISDSTTCYRSKYSSVIKHKEITLPSKRAVTLYKLKNDPSQDIYYFIGPITKERYIEKFFESPQHIIDTEIKYVQRYQEHVERGSYV